MANKFNFGQIERKIKSLDLSLDLANVAKNEFMSNFKNQGFDGKAWRDVKRRTNPTKKDIRTGGSTRAILQGKRSGRLRKDVANSVSTGVKNSNLSYTLVVNNPYAQIQNEGGVIHKKSSVKTMNFKITKSTNKTRFAKKGKGNFETEVKVGPHDIVIPQRQFVGTTAELNKKLLLKINQKVNKIWGI